MKNVVTKTILLPVRLRPVSTRGLLRLASVDHRDWTHIITTITGNSIALGVFEASRRLGRRLLR